MNIFLPIKRNHRAAPFRLAARIISIMILAFLWPVRGGAQEQTPQDLDVSNSKINGKLTLTYKLKSGSQEYAWHYKIDTDTETEFTGTLTGTNENWQHGAIDIKSEKAIDNADNNHDSYPILKLDGLNLTSTANSSLFNMVENGKPLCIQATGQSASTLKCQGVVINNVKGCYLLLDGGAAGLNILGKGNSNGIYLFTDGQLVNAILKGKIDIVADNKYAVVIGNLTSLSAAEDARITVSAGLKAILDNNSNAKSPFLEWRFDSSAPESGKTLEIKDANGKSFDPAIQFTTDDKNRHFAINVKKDAGYTVWLGNKKLMDKNETTVFTATDDKLFSFTGMQTYLAKDWPDYGQTANVGADGTDVSLSGTEYTIKTPCGLAWIAWVTNNEKTKEGNTGEMYTDYYPASAGFAGCTVTLAGNISLDKPTGTGIANDFEANWSIIGNTSGKPFKGTFDGSSHTVSDLSITTLDGQYHGLFGCIEGAVIKDLRVEGNIEGSSSMGNDIYVGGIVGFVNSSSKIIACSNTVEIAVTTTATSSGLNIGGIAGQVNSNIYIRSCWNEASLTGTSSQNLSIGGIVGSSNSLINNCYSSGTVSGKGTSTLAVASGGIVGYIPNSAVSKCYATGSVSAINSEGGGTTSAGGIVGHINTSGGVNNCLALNTGDGITISANGTTSHVGRVVGQKEKGSLDQNYASTKIQLQKGSDPAAAPTENIADDAINGADIYLDEVSAEIAAWAGSGTEKAFSAIGTGTDGKLPQLKQIASYNGDNGLPTQYKEGYFLPGQPDNLTSSTYLASLEPLSLSSGDTITITLSCSNGKWSYKKGEGIRLTRFNGTVKMDSSEGASCNKLVISTLTGNPTLTFEKVAISPNDGIALTIDEGCALTINTTGEGTSTLSSSAASTLVNKGTLTLTGKGLHIGNTSTTDTHYGLDNSGTFTVTDPAATSVTFHCAGTAIHNTGTGTLGNAWMEWQFAKVPESYENIAFAATDDANQSSSSLLYQGKTFATTVTAGKTYRLWKVTNAGVETRTPQKGKNSAGTFVSRFAAPSNNGVAVYTEVQELKTIEITESKNFSEADCATQDVVVKSNGVLTVDADDAFVFNLKLEAGAQLITTKPLKVSETFSTTRTLANKWTTFGSPVALTASVEEGENQLLYAATGYTGKDASSQSWNNISGTTAEGTNTAALAADTPYLLAAENTSTTVTFAATAPVGQPIEIPATATVTLGDALANGKFLFQTNPNLANLKLSGIYVLNADGTRFELQTGEYVVKPFEAFIVANAVTRARVASLKIGEGIATGIEQPLAAVTARVWGTRGSLHVYSGEAAALTVVRSDGRVVYATSIAPGDTRLDLPSGIYMVRINNITYKIAL